MMHTARAEKWDQGWLGVCQDCNWLGSDHQTAGPAAREAREHRHSQSPPWTIEGSVEAWGPGRDRSLPR
jgi:hypothetical protein